MNPKDTLGTAHKPTGNRWLDLVVGSSAMLIAVISLGVSLRQSQIMERQLAASVWPHLQYGTSNETDGGKPVISFEIENAGVGPAVVHSMSLHYRGKPIRSLREWVDACCEDLLKPLGRPDWMTSTVHDQVLLPGRRKSFMVLTDSPGNAPYWQRLDVERHKVQLKICYCSVLDQCWLLDSWAAGQQPIAACPAAQDSDYGD